MSILVVELQKNVREVIVDHLSKFGVSVRSVATIAQMNLEIQNKPPTVLIMDGQPLNRSGISGIANLRQRFPQVGIVVAGIGKDHQNHIQALQDGADHFLPKPMNLDVLTAIVSVLFRRMHIHVESIPETERAWKFNRRSQILSGPSDVRLAFSSRESAILTTLFLSPHFPVSTERLFHSLNMSTKIFDPHRIDMIIYRIRKKLRLLAGPTFKICNVYGQGYLCVGSDGDATFYVGDGQ